MNKRKLADMVGKMIHLRPMIRRIADDGSEPPPIEDVVLIRAASPGELELFIPRTHHHFKLGTDHIREYMTDRTGGSGGFLHLKSQISLSHRGVSVEPLDQTPPRRN